MERGIDFSKLFTAKTFYEFSGFTWIDVPWTVDEDIANITKPLECKNFIVNGKCLVASAEQSFLQLSLKGDENGVKLKPGKYAAMTPCFRDESVLDRLHSPYFMKIELFQSIDVNMQYLGSMIEAAETFFKTYCMKVLVAESEDGFDITTKQGIELGSYGIREYEGFKWIFGTGCAEPRLTRAIIR